MKMRRGICLTEMLVVMGTSTVALLASIGLLQQALTQQRYAEEQCSVHRVAERLTMQFRQDVHAARSAEWTGAAGEGVLRLRLPATAARASNADVQYAIQGGEVTRVVRPLTVDGQQDPSQPLHRDSFVFSNGYRIELRRWDTPDRLQLLISHERLPQATGRATTSESSRGDAGARTIAHVLAIVGKQVEFPVAAPGSEGEQP